jgi:hypothetical protein
MIAGQRAQQEARQLFSERVSQPRDAGRAIGLEARAVTEDLRERKSLRLGCGHASNIGQRERHGHP